MEEYYLYTFESTHTAIATEKLLKPVDCVVMPVPRFISASCGISVRIKPENRAAAEALVKEKSSLTSAHFHYYHIIIDKANDKLQCDEISIA